jgi:hypothetical protein
VYMAGGRSSHPTFSFSARDLDGMPLGFPVSGMPFEVTARLAHTGVVAIGATGDVSHVADGM